MFMRQPVKMAYVVMFLSKDFSTVHMHFVKWKTQIDQVLSLKQITELDFLTEEDLHMRNENTHLMLSNGSSSWIETNHPILQKSSTMKQL